MSLFLCQQKERQHKIGAIQKQRDTYAPEKSFYADNLCKPIKITNFIAVKIIS